MTNRALHSFPTRRSSDLEKSLLHDDWSMARLGPNSVSTGVTLRQFDCTEQSPQPSHTARSEEHTSELQSPCNIVCRLLLEKKKKQTIRKNKKRQTHMKNS